MKIQKHRMDYFGLGLRTQCQARIVRTNNDLLEYRNIAIPMPSPLLTPVRKDERKHGISLGFFPSNHSLKV